MPKSLFLLFLSIVFVLPACQLKTSEEEVTTVETPEGVVSLASENAMAVPLNAVFSSRNGSFSFEMTYDGALLNLVESEDESVPRYEVEGGAVIEMRSDWVDLASKEAEMAGSPVRIGKYDVYQFMDVEAACSLDVTLIPYAEEYLKVVLKVCGGDDGEAGRLALSQLLEHLVLNAK